jgi:hypothetical protein
LWGTKRKVLLFSPQIPGTYRADQNPNTPYPLHTYIYTNVGKHLKARNVSEAKRGKTTMTKRNNTSNLRLVLTNKHFCRNCGEEIELEQAREHLFFCNPEVHDAIAREYNQKERRALQIAAYVE